MGSVKKVQLILQRRESHLNRTSSDPKTPADNVLQPLGRLEAMISKFRVHAHEMVAGKQNNRTIIYYSRIPIFCQQSCTSTTRQIWMNTGELPNSQQRRIAGNAESRKNTWFFSVHVQDAVETNRAVYQIWKAIRASGNCYLYKPAKNAAKKVVAITKFSYYNEISTQKRIDLEVTVVYTG